MKLQYKKKLVWIIMGLVWLGLTIFIFFKYIPNAPDAYQVQRTLLLMGLGVVITAYYFCMPLLTYAKIDDEKILLYRNGGLIKTKIYKENLVCCRVQRKDLEFHVGNERSHAIHLDWCNMEEVIPFIKEIQKTNVVYEGNGNTILDLNEIDKLV